MSWAGRRGLDDTVQVRAYLDESASLPAYNRISLEHFHEPLPARTTLIGYPGGVVRFEIEAVAAQRGAESEAHAVMHQDG